MSDQQERADDAEQPLLQPEDAGQEEQPGAHWLLITSTMVAEMLGIGALSLPSAFARLGWAAAAGVLLLAGSGMAFSGVLFAKLGVHVPKARTFDDLGIAAYGRAGQALVWATVYVAIFGAPALLALTSASSLQLILAPVGLKHWQAGLIVLGVIIVLGQIRGLEHVSALSTAGTLGMITAITVACVKLLLLPAQEPSHMPAPSSGSAALMLVALMDVVFAYGGQQNFVRYISGMRVRDRGQFKSSVALGSAILTAAFAALGAIGYWRLGKGFDQTQPITAALPHDPIWTPVMNAGVLVHCIIAYQIDLNVWTHTALHLLLPHYADPPPRSAPAEQRWRSLVVWGGTTVAGAMFAYLLASSLPYFSTMMGLVAAIGDLSAAYALPALFCLRLLPGKLSRLQRGLCWALVPLSALLTIAGAVSSGMQLWAEVHHSRVGQLL